MGELEFGGVLGAAAMLIGLPAAVFYINLACNEADCSLFRYLILPSLTDLFEWRATVVLLCWFMFLAALALLPTGSVAEGLPLRDGQKLKYRCNGFQALVISVTLFGALWCLGFPVTFLYRHFLQLAAAGTAFCVIFSAYLYARSFTMPHQQLALGGNSGYMIYDYFIGRELNPRIWGLDLKFFCELRPGLIGWVLLDLSFLAEDWQRHGSLQPALVLVTLFHTVYVADGLWNEEAILTTMDIVHDGFGFMLVFGDLVWVPFLYTLQTRFLLEHPQHWHVAALIGIVCLKILGYTFFRGANSQKNDFRKNPNDPALKHLKTLTTSSGKKLLISGWWGMCRHPNYLGDLMMATSWSLPTGFGHVWPWYYPVYFLVLLLHRAERDNKNCQQKYGRDWDIYCQLVTGQIFPRFPNKFNDCGEPLHKMKHG